MASCRPPTSWPRTYPRPGRSGSYSGAGTATRRRRDSRRAF